MRAKPFQTFSRGANDSFGAAISSAGKIVFPLEAVDVTPPPALWGVRPRRWPKRLGFTALGFLLLAGALASILYWQSQQIIEEFQAGAKKPVVAAVLPELNVKPVQVAPVGIDGIKTILAIGADRRSGEGGRGRADTILVIRVDPKKKTASMLSLPRDLRVPIPGRRADKINAAYTYGGAALLTKTVREYLGVPINHFVQVDFRGFSKVVSNLGGVYLPIDGRYYHEWAPDPANNWASIDVKPGYQRLGREDALAWVRFRHLDNDFYRAARQQLFIRTVGRQISSRVGDFGSITGILRVLAEATTSDLKSVAKTAKLANTLRVIPPDRISRVTMQGSDAMIGGVYYLRASPEQKRTAVSRWANPGRQIQQQKPLGSQAERRKQVQSGRAALVSDGGRGKSLLTPLQGLRRCAPTALPPGYRWGERVPARRYKLNEEAAVAAWATAGSGKSVLWMWSRWQTPPILEDPTKRVEYDSIPYDLYYESGKLRMVAWNLGTSRVWITNTLRNELTSKQMLALARTCRPL